MKQLIMVLSISFVMQACVAAPVKQEENQVDYPTRFSVEGIKQRREAEYAKKLAELKTQKPENKAQQLIATGEYYLMTHQSGRGGHINIPGLTQQETDNVSCRLIQMDGLGDSIYGENHLKYRTAIIKYASEFNKMMKPYCR